MVIHVDTAGILQRILIRASIAAWHAPANIYASFSCPQLSAHDHEETRVYAGSIPKVTITQNALPEKCSSQRGVFFPVVDHLQKQTQAAQQSALDMGPARVLEGRVD